MYTKLHQDFLRANFDDWLSLKGNELLSKYNSFTTTLEYFNINDVDLFRKLHLKKIFTIRPDRIRFSIITGKGLLLPHRDHNTTAVLNYYASAGEDATVFYTCKEGATAIQYPGKVESNVYTLDKLDEVGRFVANSNDAYLLDVSQVHSVEKVSEEPRLFISYLWSNHSYEEVLNDILRTKDGRI